MIPGDANVQDLAVRKRKRSDDNWRTARSVQSALKRESAALEKQAHAQAQAKMIGHELYKANKTHRQAALQAEEEIGNLHKRHCQAALQAEEEIETLHERHRRVVLQAEEELETLNEHHHERHRQVALQAEEEIGKLQERHRADIADLHKRHSERHCEDVAAHHDLEACLADTKEELGATKKELEYSLCNRRIQGQLHVQSLKQQSKKHHTALESVQTASQATIRELKASLFLFPCS